jgi:hypothetical protein
MVEPYEWAWGRAKANGEQGSALDKIRLVREGIESMPPTASTFKPAHIFDGPGIPMRNQDFIDLVEYFGGWRLPDFGNSGNDIYVNPLYPHRHLFSDCTVECVCGTKIVHQFGAKSQDMIDKEHNHDEDCEALGSGNPVTGWESPVTEIHQRLREKRLELIQKGAMNWNTIEQVGPRLGLSHDAVEKIASRNDFDWIEERKKGRMKTILTWKVLRDRFAHTSEEIGKAFGVPTETVRNYTTGNARDVQDVRRVDVP